MTYQAKTNSAFKDGYVVFLGSCCRKSLIHNNNQQNEVKFAFSHQNIIGIAG